MGRSLAPRARGTRAPRVPAPRASPSGRARSPPRPPHAAMNRSLALLLLPLALAPAACKPGSAEAGGPGPEASAPQKREVPRVRVQAAEVKEMREILTTTCAIESARQVEVAPKVGGRVVEVVVEEGMTVEEGAVLVRLDPREAAAAVEEARVALREAEEAQPGLQLTVREREEAVARAELGQDQAQREFARHENAGLISQNELEKLRLARDQALRDLESARLAVQSAEQARATGGTAVEKARLVLERRELELSYTEVVAPFRGVVAARAVRVGQNAAAGTGLITLTDPEDLRAVIYRPQRELGLFQGRGQELAIEAVPDAFPGHSFPGSLEIVSPTIDAASGSVRLTIGLEQPAAGGDAPRLLPGMLVRLNMVVDRHPEALVVRKRALQREGDRRFLFVVEGERARRVEVREGFADDLSVEVFPLTGTLAPGDAVVTVGNRDLEDGAEVRSEPEATREG